jgi:hypothetical protein
MSDLQCPATLLIVRTGAVGQQVLAAGQQVQHLVEQMDGRRVSAVYSSPTESVLEPARLTASRLGMKPILIDGLEERFSESVGEIADLHRGEAVLVFTQGEGSEISEIEVDSDGWRTVASR